MPPTPNEIVRCIRADYGTSAAMLRAGAAYCQRIASGYRFNPWAEPGNSEAYAEAADRLTAQAEEKEHAALIAAACQAEERFTLDELEEYARQKYPPANSAAPVSAADAGNAGTGH